MKKLNIDIRCPKCNSNDFCFMDYEDEDGNITNRKIICEHCGYEGNKVRVITGGKIAENH